MAAQIKSEKKHNGPGLLALHPNVPSTVEQPGLFYYMAPKRIQLSLQGNSPNLRFGAFLFLEACHD